MDKDVYEYMLDGDEECAQLWEEMIAKADDAYKADTLEELADIMKVDKQLFLSQVKQYNANVEQGIDADYGKDPEYLMPIATPPFYWRPHPRRAGGSVLRRREDRPPVPREEPGRDQAFENLFAVGADGGMLYNNMYGIDINGSMTCHGVNSARTAANTAHAFITGK